MITRRLRVPSGTQLVSRHEQRYIDDLPWSLQTSFYPMEFITRGATRLLMAEDIAQGAVRYLAETIGLEQIGYRDWITARRPDSNEQTILSDFARLHGLRDLPHGLRSAQEADAGHGDSVPH